MGFVRFPGCESINRPVCACGRRFCSGSILLWRGSKVSKRVFCLGFGGEGVMVAALFEAIVVMEGSLRLATVSG